ncbi:MAG: hypothetical protein ACLPWF_33265 [Bryobacteraceae bacterium]
MVVELELVSGSPVRLTLPEAGNFEGFYVFSMEYSGSAQFWWLLERLMTAAGRPLYAVHERLRDLGLKRQEIQRSSLQQLLRRRGYGFGIFFQVNPEFRDDSTARKQKLLFLRDPRDAVVASYRHWIADARKAPDSRSASAAGEAVEPAPSSFTEFLQSAAVEGLVGRYRRFADMYRWGQNVSLLRYENALPGWHQIAADIVAALSLPLDPLIAASIAADVPPIGDRLPDQDRPPYPSLPDVASLLSRKEIAEMENRLNDVLAAFGYLPSEASNVRPLAAPKNNPGEDTSPIPLGVSGMLAAAGSPRNAPIAAHLGTLYEPDPVLLGRLRPNGSAEMQVLGRRVIMNVDGTGCRPVIGQPATGEKTLAAFGCSFTYGIAVEDGETFCSLLQGMFPTWRVENHGVPGYGQSRNLIQLERYTQWNKPELVTFCWIRHHLFRNVADINLVKLTTENMMWSSTGEFPELRLPRATLDTNGALQMRSVRVPRKELLGIDFSDFATDQHYADQVCFRLFERANSIVTGYGGNFFVTVLRPQLSEWLAGRLAETGIPVLDASLSGDEYLCLPDDTHPNALAHRLYAERLRDYLQSSKAATSTV